MHAKIVLTAERVKTQDVRGKLCVVIDVLRATTTITAALAGGSPFVIPVETPDEAREIARSRNCLLGGERNSVRIEDFDFGNSPLEYLPDRIRARPVVFTTTNGTRAIRACDASDGLVIASFLNADAVVRLLEGQENDIFVVCAGTRGEPTLEDTVCGGMLLERLNAQKDVEARKAVSTWNEHRNDLAGMMKNKSEHGRGLMELGFEGDIDFAASLNRCNFVAIRESDSIVRKAP